MKVIPEVRARQQEGVTDYDELRRVACRVPDLLIRPLEYGGKSATIEIRDLSVEIVDAFGRTVDVATLEEISEFQIVTTNGDRDHARRSEGRYPVAQLICLGSF